MSHSDNEGLDLSNNPNVNQCPECGRVYVHLHKCGTRPDERPNITVDERERLSDLDDRPADEPVVFLRGRSDSAYHRPDPDAERPEPACEAYPQKAHSPAGDDTGPWVEGERAECRDNSFRYPCRACHDLDEP